MNFLSNRLEFFQESVIREMTRKAIENNAINLSQGMPDFSPPLKLIEGIKKGIEEEEHQYSVTHGRVDLRKQIALKLEQYNKIRVNPYDEITITCGASEAIASTILALTNPGDEILIFEPWYENYVPITYLAQGKPKFVSLTENTYDIDEEQLKDSINEKTKAILINTPHNPTGKVFTKDDLNLISDLCVDHRIIAITDEIYEYIIFNGLNHQSIGSFDSMQDLTITISGFSKTFSVTGWRIGYVAACKKLMDGVRKVHDYLTVCAPSLLQLAALNAFKLDTSYFDDLKNRYQINRDYFHKELSDLGMKVFKPEGAYYMFANISQFGMDDLKFSEFLVKDEGVAVVPGSSFYSENNDKNPGSNYVRFSISQKLETLKEAIKRIKTKLI
ncbi:MAG: pyridoxal phosphate-dependent aminotransferase [Candidatus Lokiarchaeota archaeon]|nr:pyridoxal phosphate-dependent aminotransferase [Candidatus Lokiarchaeota archaeon]